MRVYQSKNIIGAGTTLSLEGSYTLLAGGSGGLDNLKNNLGARTTHASRSPYAESGGPATTGQYTCAQYDTAGKTEFAFKVDHGSAFFVHAVLLVLEIPDFRWDFVGI